MQNKLTIFSLLGLYALGVAGGVYFVASHYGNFSGASAPSATATPLPSQSLTSIPETTQKTGLKPVSPSPSSSPVTSTSTSPSPSPLASPTTSSSSSTAKIVFASDFGTNGGCADHGDHDQCDLYTANLDLSSGQVSSVTRRTSTTDSEAYPVWNPNGKVAYYSVFHSPQDKTVGYVDLVSGAVATLLSAAEWPEVSPDGQTFLYDLLGTGTLEKSSLSSDGKSLGSASALTGSPDSQTDSEFSKDGRYVVFHQIGSDRTAHGAVYDTQTKTTALYTERTGHCAINQSGTLTVCDNSSGGGLYARSFANDALGTSYLYLADMSPSQLTAYDPAFANCGGASFNYPNFCGDDNHLLTSVSCSTSSTTIGFSRLFMIIFKNGVASQYFPLGKSLDDADTGPGKSSWTVDCLK